MNKFFFKRILENNSNKITRVLTLSLFFIAVYFLPSTNIAEAATYSCVSVSGATNWNAAASWTGCNNTYPGNITLSGNTVNVTFQTTSSQTLTLGGALTHGISSITFPTTGAYAKVIDLNGYGMTITGALSMARPANNGSSAFNINTGSLNVGTTITLGGTTGGVRTTIINISTGTLTATGNITSAGVDSRIVCSDSCLVNAGGTFMSGTLGTFTASTGKVNRTGDGANMQSLAYTYYDLEYSGSGDTTASAAITIQGDLINTGGGTLNFGSQNVTLSGTDTQSIEGFTTTGTVSMTKTSQTATFTGNVNGGALTMNGNEGTLNLGEGFTHVFTGTFTRTNGTLNVNTSTLELRGVMSGSTGTFTASSGTVKFTRAGTQTLPVTTYKNIELGGTSAKTMTGITTVTGDFTMSGSASTSGNAVTTIGGSLNIQGGTFTATNGTLSIGGSFSKNGTFTHNNGTVVFDGNGESQIAGGNTTFYNFTVTTPGKVIKFKEGGTVRFNGLLTLTGADGNPIVLDSINGSGQWTINHQGTEDINFVTVNHNTCHASGTEISNTNTTDGGTNIGTCWGFPIRVSISGIAYQSVSTLTPLVDGVSITIYKNGSTLISSVTTTDNMGLWSTSGLINSGDIVTIYIDNNLTYSGNLVLVSNGLHRTDLDIFGGTLVVRDDVGAGITNTDLATGYVSTDAGDMVYSVSGGNLNVSGNLNISGGVFSGTGDVTVSGSMTGGGSVDLSGGTFTQRVTNSNITFGPSMGLNSWTERMIVGRTPTTEEIKSIIYDPVNAKYLALVNDDLMGNWDVLVHESTDLINWTERVVVMGDTDEHGESMIYVNGKYIIGGQKYISGTRYDAMVWESTDLTNWTERTVAGSVNNNRNIYSIIYDSVNSKYVATGNKYNDASGIGDTLVWESTDLISWTERFVGTVSDYAVGYSIIYDSVNSKYVIGGSDWDGFSGESYAMVWESTNLISWTFRTVFTSHVSDDITITKIIYDSVNSKYIAIGYSEYYGTYDAMLWESTDLISWTTKTIAGGVGNQTARSIFYDPVNAKYVVGGSDSSSGTFDAVIWESTNLFSWTPHIISGGPGFQSIRDGFYDSVNNKYIFGIHNDVAGSQDVKVLYSSSILNSPTWNFNNLTFSNSSGSMVTTTINSPLDTLDINVNGTLTIGNAGDSANTILDLYTNDKVPDINGSLVITNKGSLSAPATTPLTIGGSFTDNGTFTHNNGTVIFDGNAESQIDGSNTVFYNFTVTTPNKVIKFKEGETIQFNGLLTLTGTDGNQIVLDSIDGSGQWTINHQGIENIDFIIVNHNTCHASSTEISNTNTTDGGTNIGTCWGFSTGTSISGIAYQSASTLTPLSNSTPIAIYKNGSTLIGNITITGGDGSWSASGEISSGDIITVYIDNDGTFKGNLVFVSDGTAMSDLNVYGGILSVRNDTGSGITNANLATGYVSSDSGDMVYSVSSGNLTVSTNYTLQVYSGKTYLPGGTVTTQGTGSLHLSDNSTATLGNATNAIANDIIVDTGATLNINTDTTVGGGDITTAGTAIVTTTSGTPTVTISGTGSIGGGSNTLTFYNLTTSGSGTFTNASDIFVSSILNIGSGTTLTGAKNVTVTGGTVTGNGTISLSNPSVFEMRGTGSFGGSSNWTFYDLTFGSGSVASTTIVSTGGTTVSNNLTIGASSKMMATSASGINVGNNWVNNGTFYANAGTVTMTSTATGKTFTGVTSTNPFYNLTLNGSGGGWSNSANMTVLNNLVVTAGTLSGSGDVTVNGGNVTGDGTINKTAGTFTLTGTGNFGGSSNWTFYDLTFGTGSSNTTTVTGSGNIVVTNVLTVATNQLFNAGTKTYTLTGTGSPLVLSGVLGAETSAFTFGSISGGQTIPSATYYKLTVAPASGTNTFTFASGTITINNDFTISNTTTSTVTANTNNPTLIIGGTFSIGSGTTFVAPPSSLLTLAGNFTNDGTFTANGGTFVFSTTTTSTILSTSNMSFYNLRAIIPGATLAFKFQTSDIPTFSIIGTMTVTGNESTPVYIESASSGSKWLVNFSSSQNAISYASIRDSGCASGSASVTSILTNTNRGNNDSCWGFIVYSIFSSGPVYVESGSGGGDLVVGGGSGGGSEGSEGGSGGGEAQTGGGSSGGGEASP